MDDFKQRVAPIQAAHPHRWLGKANEENKFHFLRGRGARLIVPAVSLLGKPAEVPHVQFSSEI